MDFSVFTIGLNDLCMYGRAVVYRKKKRKKTLGNGDGVLAKMVCAIYKVLYIIESGR